MQLQDVIIEFTKKKTRYRGYDPKTVKNLLLGKDDAPSFFWKEISGILSVERIDDYTAEIYRLAVRDAVISYVSTKDSAIDIFRMLTEYIEKEMQCKIPIEYPPIPVSNTFERLMYISKYFHNEENTVSELTNKLWVGERTIEGDLAKLRGMDDDPLQVCGRKFTIDEVERENGRMVFKSTVHPFFLTCNLTQVVGMLKGLDSLSEIPEWKGYTRPLSNQIWEQLSDYGRERIKKVLSELMPDGMGLVEKLEKDSDRSFFSESYCSSLGQNAMYQSMKGGGPCTIEYMKGKDTEFIENVIVLRENNESFTVEVNGEKRELDRDKIIRSAIYKERLFS